MGRFIDSVSLEAIDAVMAAIADDALLLRVSFFAEDVSRLNEIVELLPPDRLKRIIHSAAIGDADTWGEAMSLIASVDSALSTRLAAITGDFEIAVLERILRSTEAIGCWDVLLPIVATMTELQQRRIIGLLSTQTEALLLSMLRAVVAAGQGKLLLALAAIDAAANERLAQLASAQGIGLDTPPVKSRKRARSA
jgi:hypothetical protein